MKNMTKEEKEIFNQKKKTVQAEQKKLEAQFENFDTMNEKEKEQFLSKMTVE